MLPLLFQLVVNKTTTTTTTTTFTTTFQTSSFKLLFSSSSPSRPLFVRLTLALTLAFLVVRLHLLLHLQLKTKTNTHDKCHHREQIKTTPTTGLPFLAGEQHLARLEPEKAEEEEGNEMLRRESERARHKQSAVTQRMRLALEPESASSPWSRLLWLVPLGHRCLCLLYCFGSLILNEIISLPPASKQLLLWGGFEFGLGACFLLAGTGSPQATGTAGTV